MTATEGQKNLTASSPFGIGAGTVGGHVGPRTWAVRDAVAVVAAVARLAMRECPVRDVHRDKLEENFVSSRYAEHKDQKGLHFASHQEQNSRVGLLKCRV